MSRASFTGISATGARLQHRQVLDANGVPCGAVMLCEEGCEGPQGRNATEARRLAKIAGWARSYPDGRHELWRCFTHRRRR